MPLLFINEKDENVRCDAIVRFYEGDSHCDIKACNYYARYYLNLYGSDLSKVLDVISRYHLKTICFDCFEHEMIKRLRSYLDSHECNILINVPDSQKGLNLEHYSYLREIISKQNKVLLSVFKLGLNGIYQTPFASLFEKMMIENNVSELDVIKRSNAHRLDYSKIRYGSINPSKENVYALGIAARLNKEQIKQLLNTSSHPSDDIIDKIINDFIEKDIYDIDVINEALFAYDVKQLII